MKGAEHIPTAGAKLQIALGLGRGTSASALTEASLLQRR